MKKIQVLSTRMVSDETIQAASKSLQEKLSITLELQETLESSSKLAQVVEARKAEIASMESEDKSVPQQKPGLGPAPPRACFVCKKDIEGKLKQCSACKAIIYCSPDCAVSNSTPKIYPCICPQFFLTLYTV
jgi:hypothetical protein